MEYQRAIVQKLAIKIANLEVALAQEQARAEQLNQELTNKSVELYEAQQKVTIKEDSNG